MEIIAANVKRGDIVCLDRAACKEIVPSDVIGTASTWYAG
jgi:hypothetical protein